MIKNKDDPLEMKTDKTNGPPTRDEVCEEDILATPTTDRGEAGGPGLKNTLTVSGCVYMGGGNCVEHGPGARRYWRPKPRTVGPDGRMSTRGEREDYYECNVGQRGRGRFRQTRLSSFVKTTPKRN